MLKISNDAEGLTIRAKAHFKLHEYEECIIDCEEAMILEASEEIEELMHDAKSSLRDRKPKSSFEILGVTKLSPVEAVKNFFRKLSLMYHSDKHPHATTIDKKKLERKFKEINNAYNVIMSTM